jgi:hypothetical protein
MYLYTISYLLKAVEYDIMYDIIYDIIHDIIKTLQLDGLF